MAKFKFSLSVGLVGCNREQEFEVPDEDLEDLDPESEEYADVVDDYAKDLVDNYMEWGWEPVG